jgi:hypothetical protein
VSNIRDDQRSLITLAKVGGLVGKVTEIDEKTRFRVDYVRMKIACRDVSKVPKFAEGVLGLTLYDFGFEREILEANKVLRSGLKVSDDQPPNKKSKADFHQDSSKQDRNTRKQVMMIVPPKMQHVSSAGKMMKDAQKAYTRGEEDGRQDKVNIPENIEESDSEGDSFGERLRKFMMRVNPPSRLGKRNSSGW